MKRTRRKSVLRGVRGSLNRFLSILFIVALGAGFLAGLEATRPDMAAAADDYMDESAWYDVDLKGTLGLTEDDVSAVRALPQTEAAQPARVLDAVLTKTDKTSYTARIFGYLDANGETLLNRPQLLSGRMPQTASECVIQLTTGGYTAASPQIGDTLTLSAEEDPETWRGKTAGDSLTVVGLARSPMFISIEAEPSAAGAGAIGLGVYVMSDFFTFDEYTDLYVTAKGASREIIYSDGYRDKVDALKNALAPVASARASAREEEVKNAAQNAVSSAQSALDALYAAGDAQKELLKDDQTRLRQTAETVAALYAAGTESALETARALTDVAAAVRESLAGAQARLEAGQTALNAQSEALKTAREQANAIKPGEWYILTREDSIGYASYRDNIEKVAALCKGFPMFFFLVALLVALTTMTRLVEEKRTEIGTLKALGFSNGQVLSEYMLYSLLASLLGCALGFAVGFRIFPFVISNAYGMMYNLPQIKTPFRPAIALTVAPVTIGGILLATWSACAAETRACPARLMVPRAPRPGKRIWLERIPFLWDRMSFTKKVTARNIFRYKKRLLMTVLGVAGCSALLLTGFGLRDSINDIVDKQFGEIYRYDLMIMVGDAEKAGADERLSSLLSDEGTVTGWLAYASENGKALVDGKSQPVSFGVPRQTARLSEFITLRGRVSKKDIALSQDGVVLTEKLCEQLGVSAGGEVTLENAAGKRAKARVLGVTENYVTAFCYMTPEMYEKLFAARPDFTTILCALRDPELSENASRRALQSDETLYVRSAKSIKDGFSNSVKSIDAIVLVLILSAGILSMVVLYNLTNVNICERRKELATIRVLGFYERETERYIFREINLLSVLGTLLGLLIGIFLHAFVVRTVEVSAVMFGRTIYPLSYLYAFLISMGFTLLVNRVMRKSIASIDMVESMKAND